jgi:hypothetical protein
MIMQILSKKQQAYLKTVYVFLTVGHRGTARGSFDKLRRS